ncbi:hypothetical protein MHPYR_530046 [uncultured Mycobacterium sp.]|uniref:Uncharacterized protein n=1 Tax=uncultured Mycobacterium sp. TaxID=171292 RepID=A0A1Y5PLQ4_9MYCO|nr:hypothetical protein MHPYR_530046 [uncultured Mycobacterium sp.]
MTDSNIISDPYRVPVTAQRLEDGRIILHTPGRQAQFFSPSEVARLYEFSLGRGVIQRHGPAA